MAQIAFFIYWLLAATSDFWLWMAQEAPRNRHSTKSIICQDLKKGTGPDSTVHWLSVEYINIYLFLDSTILLWQKQKLILETFLILSKCHWAKGLLLILKWDFTNFTITEAELNIEKKIVLILPKYSKSAQKCCNFWHIYYIKKIIEMHRSQNLRCPFSVPSRRLCNAHWKFWLISVRFKVNS